MACRLLSIVGLLFVETEGNTARFIHKAPFLLVLAPTYNDGKTVREDNIIAYVDLLSIHWEESFACLVDDETGVVVLNLGHTVPELAAPPPFGQRDDHLRLSS